jgi:hypothetical protein
MKTSVALCLALAAPYLAAQNCLDPNFGTLLSTNPQDVLLPIQSIGFAFPMNGTTYTDVHITDHGYVQLSNGGVPAPIGGAALYTPTIVNFTGATPKIAALYADIIGTGGGTIHINSSATRCLITWDNMQNFGIATPRFSFQLALFVTGEVRIVFGANVTNNSTFAMPSDNGICGINALTAAAPLTGDLFATPGPTVNPFSGSDTFYEAWTVPMTFDIASGSVVFLPLNPAVADSGYLVTASTATGCATATSNGAGCGGLSMAASGLPIIGSSNFTVTLSGLVLPPLGVMAFGSASIPAPGIPVGGGCSALMNFDIGAFGLNGPNSFTLPLPNSSALVGATLGLQGVELRPALTPPFVVSNGVAVTVGY